MIREAVKYGAIVIVSLLAGYTYGATVGFRAAVRDYVENDATMIEQTADKRFGEEYEF